MDKVYKMPDGPSAYVDIDDTIIKWAEPTASDWHNSVEIEVRGIKESFLVNEHNLNYVKKLAVRGHIIVFWSAAGAIWCEAVVKALGLEKIVSAVMSKPTYYIDDIADSNKFMGKHVFFDENGNRKGYIHKEVE
jgi:phosphoserine phosphatase